MKKTVLLIVVIFILVFVWIFVRNINRDEAAEIDQQEELVGDEKVESDVVTEDTHEPDEMVDTEELIDDDEDTSMMYSIDSGSSVYYVVQKEFLGKDAEMVRGTSGVVSGTIMITPEDQVSIDITVDGTTLVTGVGGRDKEVAKLLDDTITVVADDVSVPGVTTGAVMNTTIPVTITINGTAQLAEFDIQGSVADGMIIGGGDATASIAGFDLVAPSAAGIYTVNDSVTLGIEFSATKSN